MIRKLTLTALAALALSLGTAQAQEEHEVHIEDFAFSFEGPFGSYDRNQLQRGLQVYTEVCSTCHGLKFVPIRALSDEGGPEIPEDQVRAYAAAFAVLDEEANPQLYDTEKDAYRALLPSDHFPLNNSQGAPDLSMMAKARKGFSGPMGLGITQIFKGIGGPEYIASLLTGYSGESKEEAGNTFYANKTFSTGWIRMPAPLTDGLVTFADGSPNDVVSMSKDVAAFLMWTAEPKLMQRKESGLLAVLFLVLLSVLLYLTNKRLWAPHKGKASHPAE